MKISRNWLQTYFADELPDAERLGEALTFHAFEIDGVEDAKGDAVLDVKITPNRGHDCLCHFGIAKELSAILKVALKSNPLAAEKEIDFSAAGLQGDAAKSTSFSAAVAVSVDTPLCNRYIAGYIKGVKVGPSPDWLRERLESIGQRSINNVVDATNYVMFDLGQPLHAFDAGKLELKDGKYSIAVRAAKAGEKMLALDEKEYQLGESTLVIADANKDEAIGIAGVKGGMPAGITEATTDIILESANFDGVSVRKTAQALKLRTDASQRFEQQISPELAAYGMRAVADLIVKIAGGELQGFVDIYPKPQQKKMVSVSVEKINQILGVSFTGADVADVFQRLGFAYKEEHGLFEVVVPLERLDIEIPEDLVEEVGRIQGYDKVLPLDLPPFTKPVEINKNFYAAEKAREELLAQGYSEVFTSVFVEKGERVVLNKVDGVKPYMRTTLVDGLADALKKNIPNKDLLGLKKIKLFEVGAVWKDGKEQTMLGTIVEGEKATEKMLEPVEATTYQDLPLSTTERYQVFSRYPYVVRDISMFVPQNVEENKVGAILLEIVVDAIKDQNLSFQRRFLDRFEKDGKISVAFRFIFQSNEKTLTDEQVNSIMEKVYAKLGAEGFKIR